MGARSDSGLGTLIEHPEQDVDLQEVLLPEAIRTQKEDACAALIRYD